MSVRYETPAISAPRNTLSLSHPPTPSAWGGPDRGGGRLCGRSRRQDEGAALIVGGGRLSREFWRGSKAKTGEMSPEARRPRPQTGRRERSHERHP